MVEIFCENITYFKKKKKDKQKNALNINSNEENHHGDKSHSQAKIKKNY